MVGNSRVLSGKESAAVHDDIFYAEDSSTYGSQILLVELWTNDCCFHIVFDLCHAWKTTQRRRQGLLNVSICILGHLNLQPGKVQVGEHTVV